MEKKLSVIIVDDFQISRLGMRYMLNSIDSIEEVKEAASSKELFLLLKKTEPDFIFMDVQLGDEYGFDVTRQVLLKYPDTYVLAVTSSREVQHFSEMIEAGAVGFLLKNILQSDIEKAISEVLDGKMYFSKEFRTLASQLKPKRVKKSYIKLSEREIEVLKLICKGNSNQEIASELELSTHTIDGHRKKLLHKIGARNTASMIAKSIQDGLIDLSST